MFWHSSPTRNRRSKLVRFDREMFTACFTLLTSEQARLNQRWADSWWGSNEHTLECMWMGSLTSSTSSLCCCDLYLFRKVIGTPVPCRLLLAAEQLLCCQTLSAHTVPKRIRGPGRGISKAVTSCSVVCLIWIIFNLRPSAPEQLSPVQPKQRDSSSRRSLRMVPLVRRTG